MCNKLLSVSIAAYNVESYLDECLRVFADDEFSKTIDVMIVDDGSTDDTSNIAEKYAARYPSIFTYIKKENGGWGSTVNEGIKNAKGKYFKQLDGDDYFSHNDLLRLMDKLQDCNADVVITDYDTFLDETAEKIGHWSFDSTFKYGVEYKVDDLGRALSNLTMHGLTVKTSLLENVRLTEKCFYTDIEFLIKALSLASTVQIMPYSIYNYRVGRAGQSVSLEGMQRHYKEHLIVLKNTMAYVENCDATIERKHILYNRLSEMARAQYERYLCLPIATTTKKELITYDQWIKGVEYIDIHRSKIVRLLRGSNYLIYPILAHYEKNRIKKMY